MINWKSILKHYLYRITNSNNNSKIVDYFSSKNVIEIGGPSSIFNVGYRAILPIYEQVNALDNVNYSYETIWEKKITAGNTYKYGNRIGKQFVLEASNLYQIDDNSYDCLISSHCLEHTANPIKVLLEWKRVVVNNGYLLLILPNKKHTFDHKRNDTTFEHLKNDFESNTNESDLSHIEEILALHDKTKDYGLRGVDFRERSLDNFKNRCLHHHVFNDELIEKIAKYTNLKLIQNSKFDIHLIYLLQK